MRLIIALDSLAASGRKLNKSIKISKESFADDLQCFVKHLIDVVKLLFSDLRYVRHPSGDALRIELIKACTLLNYLARNRIPILPHCDSMVHRVQKLQKRVIFLLRQKAKNESKYFFDSKVYKALGVCKLSDEDGERDYPIEILNCVEACKLMAKFLSKGVADKGKLKVLDRIQAVEAKEMETITVYISAAQNHLNKILIDEDILDESAAKIRVAKLV